MPQIVPLQVLPNQTLQCSLNGQAVTLNVFQQRFGLYMDVFLSNQAVVQGIACLNGALIIRNTYFGFSGDFVFMDRQGTTDPNYLGFGTRYALLYLNTTDLAALNLPAGVA